MLERQWAHLFFFWVASCCEGRRIYLIKTVSTCFSPNPHVVMEFFRRSIMFPGVTLRIHNFDAKSEECIIRRKFEDHVTPELGPIFRPEADIRIRVKSGTSERVHAGHAGAKIACAWSLPAPLKFFCSLSHSSRCLHVSW